MKTAADLGIPEYFNAAGQDAQAHERSRPHRAIVRPADRVALTRIESPERDAFGHWHRRLELGGLTQQRK